MATMRPAVVIGLWDIVFGFYKSGEPWPRSRSAAIQLAVEKKLQNGTDHIEDNIDEEEWATATQHALKLFPDLKGDANA